jgi:hypothetical protein
MHESREKEDGHGTQDSAGQQEHPLNRHQRSERWFEVVTAILLGVVAVATAWSGYQATRWSGDQSTLYAEASTLRVESTRDATLATQYELYDVITLNNWINAYTQGNSKLANIYERRFRPEFQPAFTAWMATDPFTNPKAPPGPFSMPQYKLSLQEQANQLDAKSAQTFAEGQVARDQGDAYVRITVLLAMILFLTAITENFEWNTIRAVILIVATGILLFCLFRIFTYPIM